MATAARSTAADPLALPPSVPEVHHDEKEEPTEKPAEDEEMQREPPHTSMIPGASRSSRGGKRTETQEDTSVKKRFTTKSPTERHTATFVGEPVKRRLTEKTDTKNDDVLMPVEDDYVHIPQRRDQCGNESLE